MSERRAPSHDQRDQRDEELVDAVARKQARKLRSRAENGPSLARGLGASGAIGWSIAVPTLLGIALGVWLDSSRAESFSWTLTLMGVGLALGCLSAWHWLNKESRDD